MSGPFLLFASIVGLLSSSAYLILVLRAAARFRSSQTTSDCSTTAPPAVSVLKPLHGVEPLLEKNLESFFRQDYPDFEIIFGVRDRSDPALTVVESLQKKYPHIKTTVVLSGEPAYPNAKVFALEKMLAEASASYLVIADSDAGVKPDCLKEVVLPLTDPRVGVVSCLYRGVGVGGVWSQLEALGMSVEMSSGVLVAEMLEGMKFALGPTMATRKDVLDLIGGIGTLAEYCADDYLLGFRAYEAGKKVVLSRYVIQHVATSTAAKPSLAHQVRWMRSTRFSRPAGHAGTGLTYAMPFGLLGLAAGWSTHHWGLGIALFGWAFLNRVVQSIAAGWGVLGDTQALRLCWLYPVRDLLGFFVWCASYAGTEIVWRGTRYQLSKGGKMTRVTSSRPV